MAAVLVFAVVFAIAAVISLAVAVSAWRRRELAPGYSPIAVLAAGAVWWSLASMIGLFLKNETAAWWMTSLTYLGVAALVAGWWATARALADRFWRLRRRSAALLTIEPLLCAVALATNPWHHLFVTELRPTVVGGAYAAVFGPLFWVHALYCYVMITVSSVAVIRIFIRATSRHRGYLLIVLTTAPSLVINLIGTFSGGRLVDLTAIGFALAAPVMYWVVHNDSGPGSAPVAHHELFRIMSDLVIVVDEQRRILDHNPAAGLLLERLGVSGRRLPEAFGDLPADGHSAFSIADIGGTGTDLNIRLSGRTGPRRSAGARVLVARDVTEHNRQRRALEEANDQLRAQLETIERLRNDLAEQAFRDHLTGLHNRRHLMSGLSARLAGGRPFSVALVDIDHFKKINDGYGHNAGDDVLKQVAQWLAAVARPGDLVARYGGEEFAIVLDGAGAAEAHARVDEVRRAVAATALRAGDTTVTVTVSAGIAEAAPGQDITELIHDADVALYAAKDAGRDRVRVSEPVSVR